jgi:3-(3-hydroxy-phenyl)propionate hydroxylase
VRALVATAKEFGKIIGELDPTAATIRDETLRAQLERGEAETIRQRFVPNLTTGVIDRDPRACGAGSLFVQPRVRRLVRQEVSGDPVLLDDLLQFRFLIATTAAEAQAWLTPESRELWRRLGGERIVIGLPERTQRSGAVAGDDIQSLVETDDLFTAWMSQLGSAAVVVRPDRYVFGAASDAAQLNRLAGAVGRYVLGP